LSSTALPRRLVLTGARPLLPGGGGFGPPRTIATTGGHESAFTRHPGGSPDSLGDGPGAVAVDLEGRWVVPGLIDAHFHTVSRSAAVVDEQLVALGVVEGVASALSRLDGGVTTVRDAGCRHHGVFAVREAAAEGLVRAPRIFAAGRNPTGPAAPNHWRNVVVEGPAQMAAAVDAELDAGADWVKFVISHAEDPKDWSRVTVYLGEEEVRAGVEAAHARGARVSAHVEGEQVAAVAVRCGVDALEHSPLVNATTAAEMAARGVVYVPTLWAFSDDSGLDGYAGPLAHWAEQHRQSVRRALAAGVVVAAGSDAAGTLPPPDVLVSEIEALVGAGLSPEEALRAATEGGAAALGRAGELGTLAVGALADLVVLEADPLEEVGNLRRVAMVVSRGSVVLDRVTGRSGLVDDLDLTGAAARLAGVVSRWGGGEQSVPARVVARLREATGASRTTVRLCGNDGSLDLVAESLAPGAPSMYGGSPAGVREAPTYRYLETEKTLLVQEDCRNAEVAPPVSLLDEYDVRAQMLAPVIIGGRLVATISVHQQGSARRWSPADVAALEEAQEVMTTFMAAKAR